MRPTPIVLSLSLALLVPGCIFESEGDITLTILNADTGGLPIHIVQESGTFEESNRLAPGESRPFTLTSRSESIDWKAGRLGIRFIGATCTAPESGARLEWDGDKLVGVNYSCVDKP